MRIKISSSPPVLFRIVKPKTKNVLKEKILYDYSLNWEDIHLEKKNPQYESKIIYP